MNYRIVWRPEAEQLLIRLWLAARDRTQITEVVDRIDERLQRDPFSVGESRQDDVRLILDGPLALLIQVEVGLRVVYVMEIWRTR